MDALHIVLRRLDAAAVFGDAGGRLLLWPCTGARSTKYSVLVESCGSKVVCLTAAPGTDTPQQHHKQVRHSMSVELHTRPAFPITILTSVWSRVL